MAFVRPGFLTPMLPFTNLSNDPEQQYFTDGITGDLTTDLSRIPDMLVISRNTAFTYRNKPVDTKQIGRELGVRGVMGPAIPVPSSGASPFLEPAQNRINCGSAPTGTLRFK